MFLFGFYQRSSKVPGNVGDHKRSTNDSKNLQGPKSSIIVKLEVMNFRRYSKTFFLPDEFKNNFGYCYYRGKQSLILIYQSYDQPHHTKLFLKFQQYLRFSKNTIISYAKKNIFLFQKKFLFYFIFSFYRISINNRITELVMDYFQLAPDFNVQYFIS